MGAAAFPLLAATAGAGLVAYTMGNSLKNQNNASAESLMQLSNQQSQDALNTLPETPTDIDTGENDEAEAARRQQQQAMAANEARVNPTGSLGVTSTANTKKKTLGGA